MEDPLPKPSNSRSFILLDNKTKLMIVVLLCLFIGLGLIICPHVVLKNKNHGNLTIELTSNISQAPRGIYLGALAVLPPKYYSDIAIFSLARLYCFIVIFMITIKKEYFVNIWYGSCYI